MILDDLKTQWKDEIAKDTDTEKLTLSGRLLDKEVNKIDSLVKKQNIIEITTAILFLPFILYFLLTSNNLMQTIGLYLWLYVCLYTPYKLVKARNIKVSKNKSIKTFLQREIAKTIEQLKLIKSFVWWNILPTLSGLVLISAGAKVDSFGVPQLTPALLGYYFLCILGAIGIYFYNQRLAKTKFQPLLDKLEKRLKELLD